MSKINIVDATRQIGERARALSEKTKAIRASAQAGLQKVRARENELKELQRQENERRRQEKLLEKQAAEAAEAAEAAAAQEADLPAESEIPAAVPTPEIIAPAADTEPEKTEEVPAGAETAEQPGKPAEEEKPAAVPEKKEPVRDRPARQQAERPPYVPREGRDGQRPQGERTQGDRPQYNRDGQRPQQGTRQPYNREGGAGAQQRPQQGARQPYNREGREQGGRQYGRQGNSFAQGIASLTPTQEKGSVSNYDPKKKQYANRASDNNGDKRQQRSRRSLIQDSSNYGDEDNFRTRKPKKNKQQAAPKHVIEPIKIEHAVITTDMVPIKDLAEKIGKPAVEIIKKLMLLGIMTTINSDIDFDTAALVADEFGVELEHRQEKSYEDVMIDSSMSTDSEGELIKRPPVITVMGHVDHGKTSLLDAIRKTNVTAHEAGGITQHIGAYTVDVQGRSITFLDTPGHEAFTSMRMRGAQATDIAVLVVAADDGIMPQTIEAINHAKAADVPIIVAINKIDKPGANIERVKQGLTEYGLVPEDWGGDTVIAPVSAITGEGIPELLDMIILVADVQELSANPNRKARGIVIEAQLDKGKGPVATVLVQNGTLRVGDTIVAGMAYGRVRAMMDDKGQRVDEAGPSQPVEVLGFSEVPAAGDMLVAVEDDRLSRQVAEERRDRIKIQQMKSMGKVSLDDLFNQIEQGKLKELNLIIKADVQGSVEAVKQALEKLSNDEVRVKTIHSNVGAITESDVILASASNAVIIGFNVRPDASAKAMAEREKVDIRLYRIIYNAIEDIENAIKGMLAPVYQEVILGHAEIRNLIRISNIGVVAGSYVTDGLVRRGSSVRVLRDNVVVYEGKLGSLRRFKDDVREVASGYECGITVENFNDIKEKDVLEIFVNEEIKA